ncbi:HAD family phosphatase [Streptomyces sp. NPDC048281]|uniref:HAD family hydrolase n=1 Tax=Streptomyces sp. NPDC048281 TaxID=3154715 RepID=UPI003412701D
MERSQEVPSSEHAPPLPPSPSPRSPLRPSPHPSSPVVVWDLGGVLAPSGRALTSLADALGIPEAVLAEPYWAHRDAYDLGGSPVAYWARIGEALRRPLDAAWAERLDAIDTGAWAVLGAEASGLLDRLADRGTPLGVLSNAPASLAAAVRRADWSARFDTLVFSSDLGLMKPDPRIYRGAEERLGRAASDIVFFDDRAENVAAARAHGWRAHIWSGAAAARAVLAGEGVPADGC